MVDALAVAGISTAAKLKEELDCASSTAQAVFRGDPVLQRVAIEVVHLLQGKGADVAVSTLFEEVES